MSTFYDGEHAILFGPSVDVNNVSWSDNVSADYWSDMVNTWTDWHLIPSSRPTMVIPNSQSRFVEVPGMDGSYDLSEYLTTYRTYQDRSGSFEFIVDNDHEDWLAICRKISVYLHGKKLRMILTDDMEWFYQGRFSLNEWKSDPARSSVTIDYRVAPYKYSIYPIYVRNLLWDPFCFDRDIDWSKLWNIELNVNGESSTITFDIDTYGAHSQLIARLISGSSVTVSFGGVSKTLKTVNENVPIAYGNQENTTTLTLSGSGVVGIGWRKMSL